MERDVLGTKVERKESLRTDQLAGYLTAEVAEHPEQLVNVKLRRDLY